MASSKTDCAPIDYTKAAKLAKGSREAFKMFQEIPNPIPSEITDPKILKDFFSEYPFVPYASTDHSSQHSLLTWLNSMRGLSPTHGACITSLHSYALGLPYRVRKVLSKDFNIFDDVGEAQTKSFIKWLSDISAFEYGQSLRTVGTESFMNLKDNGNSFIEVRLNKVLGKIAFNLIPHPTERVCYVRPEEGAKTRYVGVSHKWDVSYVQQYPPRILPVYPAYQENDEGITTMIHTKNPNQNLYGLPDWLSSFMSVYREYQDNNYLIKQTANNFMGQALIELEEAEQRDASILDDGEAQANGFENAAHRFEENFSAKSDNPQSVILLSRPFGTKNAFVHQFKPNTSENFYKVMSELEEIDIIRAHQWSKRFLGENQTQGFSKDVFVDELKVKEVAVLPYLRATALNGINIGIQLAVDYFGKSEFKNFIVDGTSNIQELIDMMPKDMEKNNELTQNEPVEI